MAQPFDPEQGKRRIMELGGTNPVQIPDFPHHFLTDEDEVWSCQPNLEWEPRLLCKHKGIYFRLYRGKKNNVCVTSEKLRWCIEHNTSPLVMSQCKLAVAEGHELIDVTEAVQRSIKRNRKARVDEHLEEYLEAAESWTHHLLAYYHGDKSAAEALWATCEKLRPLLTAHVKQRFTIYNEDKVKFIVDETISETMYRALNRTACITQPYIYMYKLARGVFYSIRDIGFVTARVEDGNIRLKAGWSKKSIKMMYHLDP